jgi:enoyl-CoA hydratase
VIQREAFDGGVVLRLARGKANAMDLELLLALDEAIVEAERRRDRCVVLTGTGGIFSAGVELFRVVEGGRAYLERFLPALSDALARLFFTPIPVVAAINGHAIAGGAIAAFACDWRVMAKGPGRIGVPELVVGVPFPLVPLEIVRFALREDTLREAVLLGTRWDVDSARERGVVDEVVDEASLLPHAKEVARRLAAVAPATFAATKRRLRRPVREMLHRLRSEHDADTLEAWSSPTVLEAIQAYVTVTLRR